MTVKNSGRRFGPRQVRVLERLVHLVTGLALVTYVYLTPAEGSAFTVAIRWLVPVVVSSGFAMWQGPRVRRYLRRRGAGA